MIERLKYGFDEQKNPTIEVPQSVFEEATSGDSEIPAILEHDASLLRLEEGDGGVRLTYLLNQLKKIRKKYNTMGVDEAMASQWYATLGQIKRHTPLELDDPVVTVAFSEKPIHDRSDMHRRGMHAVLRWPLPDNREASIVATDIMQWSAVQFGI